MSAILGAGLIWVSAAILWWTGWREEVAAGLPHWAVGIFLTGWPISMLWRIKLSPEWVIECVWLWTLLAMLCLAVSTKPTRRWTALSVGIFLGAVYLFMLRLSYMPLLLSYDLPPWVLAAVLGVGCSLLLSHASEQLLAVSASFLLYEGVSLMIMHPPNPFYIGHTSGIEGWWIASLSARLWSMSVPFLTSRVKSWIHKMVVKRGGQRL